MEAIDETCSGGSISSKQHPQLQLTVPDTEKPLNTKLTSSWIAALRSSMRTSAFSGETLQPAPRGSE